MTSSGFRSADSKAFLSWNKSKCEGQNFTDLSFSCEKSFLTLYPPMSSDADICRSNAETHEARISKSLRAQFVVPIRPYRSVKRSFLFNALMSRYTIYKMNDFEQIRSISKIFFLTLTNIYLDELPCGIHQTKCPLVDYIDFKSFKRIRWRERSKKQKCYRTVRKKRKSQLCNTYKPPTKFCLNHIKFQNKQFSAK